MDAYRNLLSGHECERKETGTVDAGGILFRRGQSPAQANGGVDAPDARTVAHCEPWAGEHHGEHVTTDITVLLQQADGADPGALSQVFARLYDELRILARSRLQGMEQTLTPTALVNETWLRLCAGGQPMSLASRRHFFASAAQAMRWIVVDHARRQLAERRGGAVVKLELDDGLADEMRSEELLSLDGALEALGKIDPSRRQLVELRYFAGLEFEELAELTGKSSRTIKREWASTRAVLYSLME